MLMVSDMTEADALAPTLAAAGFVRIPGIDGDVPKPGFPDPVEWAKRIHGAADPGRPAHLHVRAADTASWRYALAFRDWLRADDSAREDYLAMKQRVMAAHAGDVDWEGYAADKEAWFDASWPRLQTWVEQTGWSADGNDDGER
jgi:dephospho-CoA kinase